MISQTLTRTTRGESNQRQHRADGIWPQARVGGTRSGWPMIAVHLALDVALIAAAIAGAQWLMELAGIGAAAGASNSLRLGIAFGVALLLLGKVHGLYDALPPPPAVEFRRWVLIVVSSVAALGLMILVVFGGAGTDVLWLACAGLVLVVAIPPGRAAVRRACCRASWWGTRVIVVGSGGLTAKAWQHLQRHPRLGLRPVGIIGDLDSLTPDLQAAAYLGPIGALADAASHFGVNRAVVVARGFDADDYADVVTRPSGIRHWIVLPPLEQFPSLWARPHEISGLTALELTNQLALPANRAAKRLFDLAVAVSLGLVIVPVIGVIAVLVRLSSKGPVFYSQERIGWHGRRFRAWKIRTMHPDADRLLHQYLQEHPNLLAEWQANHKLKHDPRVTWIGRWLRLSSLDEIPQIWNVLKGEMSLIGPRPIVEAEIEKYGDHYEQYIRVVPGITGLWQISGRNNTTYEERVNYDAYYVKNWSLWLDLYILACTVRVVVLGEGAY